MAHPVETTNSTVQLLEIAERAETRVQAQLVAALAADQRAMVFAGLLAAATAVLGGASANVFTSSAIQHYFGWVALFAAGGLLLAMTLAVIAARPSSWSFPGSVPNDWKEDVLADKPEYNRLLELLADYDIRIANNNRTMQINSWLIMGSAGVALATFAIAGVCTAARVV